MCFVRTLKYAAVGQDYMLNHGLKWDKWVLTNLSHPIDCGLTHLFLGLASHAWLHTSGVTTRLPALRLYHCRHNIRDRDYQCDRGIVIPFKGRTIETERSPVSIPSIVLVSFESFIILISCMRTESTEIMIFACSHAVGGSWSHE